MVAQFEDERAAHFERLLLLAPGEVVAAARAWHQAVWDLHVIADGPAAIAQPEFQLRLERAAEARDRFYDELKSCLRPRMW
ncbi:hypothetical protein [Nocardioides aquiterrae]|uniref:hypothetical protein n=1 Tax=Nocardioides aquiterrae TaxID=203799 RepID=UPI0031D03EBF